MTRDLSLYNGKVVVIKYGGNAMLEDNLQGGFASNVVELLEAGVRPVVVHGGGPQINNMLDRVGVASRFVNGMRVTDEAAIEIVEMVLSGLVNKKLVSLINRAGGRAIGLSGKDADFFIAKRLPPVQSSFDGTQIDLGLVGTVESVNCELINRLIDSRFIPVVAPIAASTAGETLNINADLVAGALAAALYAEKLLLLTNTEGVLDQQGMRLEKLTLNDIESLIIDGTISGGMLPKIECATSAVKSGVKCSHILDGRAADALINALVFEHSIGSMITN